MSSGRIELWISWSWSQYYDWGQECRGGRTTHANLAVSYVSAFRTKVLHPRQSQLTEVTVLDTGRDEWHGDIALNTIHSRPRRHESHDTRHNIDQSVGWVILVLPRSPQLIQSCAPDHKGGVELQPITPERRVLEKLLELPDIPLHAAVGQIRHHVRDDLVSCVLCHMKRLRNGADSVTTVRVPRYILVDRLHTDLKTRAAISQHLAEMRLQAVIWPRLDRDSNTLCLALFRELDRLVDVLGRVPAQGIVQACDEFVAIVLGHGHECAAHEAGFSVSRGMEKTRHT